MRIVLLQENLLKTVGQAVRFVSSKPPIPILSGILLRIQDGKLLLQTTDLKVGFQTSLAVKVEEDGEIVVPAKLLSELLATLNPGAIELKTDGDQVVVSQNKTKIKIPTFSATEFPPFPDMVGDNFEFSTKQFTESVTSVLYTASLDETRPILASLLLSIDDGILTCVCTDGYRLTVSKNKLDKENDKNLKILLPAKSVQELMSVLGHSSTKTVLLSVSRELSQAFVIMGDFMILLRLVEGEFPPYEKIIPTSFAYETTLDRESWLGALKTAMVFARESSSVITLEFVENHCRVVSVSAGVGEQEGEIESTGKIMEPKKIAFNGKFLLDVLQHLDAEHVTFKMNDELKPGLILPEGKDFPLSVVMPFKR